MSLAIVSLLWTPGAEDRYDWCLMTKGMQYPVFCSNRMVLQWVEGALLLIFSAEMAMKVGISGTNGQRRRAVVAIRILKKGNKHSRSLASLLAQACSREGVRRRQTAGSCTGGLHSVDMSCDRNAVFQTAR